MTHPVHRFVAYERVSTARQGRSGLGLEAQRKTIGDFAESRGAEVISRFTEVESGSKAERPELGRVIELARLLGGDSASESLREHARRLLEEKTPEIAESKC